MAFILSSRAFKHEGSGLQRKRRDAGKCLAAFVCRALGVCTLPRGPYVCNTQVVCVCGAELCIQALSVETMLWFTSDDLVLMRGDKVWGGRGGGG